MGTRFCGSATGDFAVCGRRERVAPATTDFVPETGTGFCGPGHDGQRGFLFAKRNPLWEPKENLGCIGRVPTSPTAVRVGTVNASTGRCRFPSACRSASIPIGRLLPRSLRHQPPGRWRKAIETAQGSGSGKRGFESRQPGRRSNGAGTIAAKALSFGSNPFSFRKENGFAVARGRARSPSFQGRTSRQDDLSVNQSMETP